VHVVSLKNETNTGLKASSLLETYDFALLKVCSRIEEILKHLKLKKNPFHTKSEFHLHFVLYSPELHLAIHSN
jgi:hypothetical protein